MTTPARTAPQPRGGLTSRATGKLTARGEQVLERSHLPDCEIACQLGLTIPTVRVYLTWLRNAGYNVPSSRSVLDQHAMKVTAVVPHAVAEELRQQAKMRGRWQHAGPGGLAAHLLAIIHKDNLYDALLGKVTSRSGAR